MFGAPLFSQARGTVMPIIFSGPWMVRHIFLFCFCCCCCFFFFFFFFFFLMDCCLCDQNPHLFRPRNSICLRCFEGAKEILEFARRLDLEEKDGYTASQQQSSQAEISNAKLDKRGSINKAEAGEAKGLADAIKHIKQLEQVVAATSRQISYLGALGDAFIEGLHADLELITEDGISIQVHKVIMAMLEMDSHKDSKNLTIRIPEISHIELKHLVEFMYTGQLTLEALEQHSLGLMLAADKYDIPLLMEICEAYIIDTMSTKNALEVLEVATRLSSASALKQAAMSTIILNYEVVLFSQEYEDFALKNPLLAIRVSQSVMHQLKSRMLPPKLANA